MTIHMPVTIGLAVYLLLCGLVAITRRLQR